MSYINSIFDIDSKKKYIFNINKIVSPFILRNDKIIGQAKELLKNNRIVIKDVKVDKEKLNYIFFETEITDFDGTIHTVKIRASETCLYNIVCQPKHDWHKYYDSTDFHRSPCKYELTALMKLNEYIKAYNPGDTTDYEALLLMNFISRNSSSEENLQKTEDIIIEMSLSSRNGYTSYTEDKKLTGTFKIGKKSRMYIVRDFRELLNIYKMCGTLRLGKLLELDFSKDDFTPESKKIFNAIEKFISENDILKQKMGRIYIYENTDDISKGNLIFDSSRIDTLYDILNENVTVDGYPVQKAEKDIKIKMSITPSFKGSEKEFDGVNAEISLPDLYRGNNNFYTINKKDRFCIFNRISSELSEIIKRFRNDNDFYSKSNKKVFHIGIKRISEFMYNTIPQMNQYIKFSSVEIENILRYMPPAAEIHYYLDAADGIPACYPRVVYNGTEYDFTDHLKNVGIKESFRDTEREISALKTAMKYFYIPEPENRRIICDISDSDTIYELLMNGLDEMMKYGQVHSTDSFDAIHIRKNYNFSMGISLESDILNLEITSTDFSPEELLDLIKSYKKKKKYHLLKSGEFVQLDERINELSMMMDTMHIGVKEFTSGKMQIPAYRAIYLDKMLESCHELYADRDSHYKKLIRSFKTINDSDFEVPEEFQGIMREYQKYGYRWLRTLETYKFGGILADDMGLGKTLQIISVISASKKENNIKNRQSLIVCPASLVYNWFEEFHKFAPEMRVLVISGVASERKESISKIKQYDVAVTSYDLLKRDIAEYEGMEFLYEVIDEAQYIKNHSTAAAKSVKLIHSRYRFALTGTPIENRLSELWSIFDYLMPNFLYGYETFRKEIEIPIVKHNDEQASRRLNRITAPFILRRLKTDVLKDLPDKLEKTQYTKFESKQQHVYDGQVIKIQQMLDAESDENFQKNKLMILAELTKIREICCDPSLVFEDYSGGSAKREACLELVHNAIDGKHRILIFSQFTSMLDLIAKDLTKADIPFYTIIGSTPKSKRLELVNDFNEGDVPVFLISLKAGGTGLNLTGADVVIHFDPWWNVAAQNQATDRAHRIGQTKTVTVYKLISKNTIEEKIEQMQEKKKNLAESVLNSESVNISSLSRKELLDLFEI